MPNPPSSVSITGFKEYFNREWPYGDGPDTVMDSDISRALAEAASNFAPNLWDSEETVSYYYILTAHVMCLNVQAAGGLRAKQMAGIGIESRGEGIINSKSAGPFSLQTDQQDESYKDPILAWFNKTEFGRKYLQAALPRMMGHVENVAGFSEPDVTTPTLPVEPPVF